MGHLSTIIIMLVLILIGLNLAANNSLVSVLVGYIFYEDRFSGFILRFSGVLMALSSLLLIIDKATYCIYANTAIFLILTFFSIRGRNKAYSEKVNARELLLKEYEDEIKRKRERIAELKEERLHTSSESDSKSVSALKKKMWDDGSMTNKDLINGFKNDQ